MIIVCVLLAVTWTPALAGGYRVTGVVVGADDGAPLAGVAVLLDEEELARTNAQGRFALVIPTPGPAMLTFRLAGRRPVAERVDSSTSALILSMKPQ